MKRKVLIIGSGISGLSCALTAAELGNDVMIVSPVSSERSQSVMAAGGINAALGDGDSIACHVADTIRGGCDIAGVIEVEQLCSDAPDIIDWLERLGTVFTRQKDNRIALRAFGGQTHRRTAFSGACTGKQIVTSLVSELRKHECAGTVTRRLGLQFYSGLIRDGRCFGALFYDEALRRMEAVYADAVVMATGGQNQLFGKTTGSMLCDGYPQGKLLEQGVKLKNLEFIQYHPTTIETPMKRMLITEGARGEGGRLFYLDGDRKVYFMNDRYGENGNLMPRDIVSKCIYDAPSQVYLDLTFLGKPLIHSRLQEVFDLCRDYAGIDVTREYIPVYPSVHFFMGGFSVDARHRTNIEQLYAVGECASIYHGANRLGGNSLLAALHSGRVAAREISAAEAHRAAPSFDAYIQEQNEKIRAMLSKSSIFPAVYIRKEIAQTMRGDLGITRCETKLRHGIEDIDYYLSIVDQMHFDVSVSAYQAYSLSGMLLLSKAVLTSALERRETRGAHIREDYPEPLERFKAYSEARYENGSISVSFQGGAEQ